MDATKKFLLDDTRGLPVEMLLELCFKSYRDGQQNTSVPSFSIEDILEKYEYYLKN